MKKQQMKWNTGFTLIELLLVVAVIGIVLGLVLTSLGNSRAKALDARIKSNIDQYRRLGEIYYNANTTSYLNFAACLTTPSTATCKGGIDNDVLAVNNDMAVMGRTVTKNATATAFCVSAPLSSTANHACKDSSGKYSEEATGCGLSTACP